MKTALLLLLVSSAAHAADLSSLNERFSVNCNGKESIMAISTSGSNPVRMEIDLSVEHKGVDYSVEMLNQKVLVRVGESDDMVPGKYKDYVKTKFTKKSITIEETSTFWLKSTLEKKLDIIFDNENLTSGKIRTETYWPKKNNVTFCDFKA